MHKKPFILIVMAALGLALGSGGTVAVQHLAIREITKEKQELAERGKSISMREQKASLDLAEAQKLRQVSLGAEERVERLGREASDLLKAAQDMERTSKSLDRKAHERFSLAKEMVAMADQRKDKADSDLAKAEELTGEANLALEESNQQAATASNMLSKAQVLEKKSQQSWAEAGRERDALERERHAVSLRENEANKALNDYANLENQLHRVRRERDDYASCVSSLRGEIHQLECAVTAAEQKANNYYSQYCSAQSKVQSLSSQVSQLQSALSAAQSNNGNE